MVKDVHTVASVNEAIDDNHLWYLAYGSNMNKKVFQGVRKIVPLQYKVVTVPEYWLSLDMMGSPYVEPCFASIVRKARQNITEEYAREIHLRCKAGTPFKWNPANPEESLPPTLHGVAYLITKDQFKRILMTEGGWGYDDFPTGYSVVDVECRTYDAEKILAKTLIARPASVKIGCQASERYLNLMREGAKEFGFEPTYQNYLFSLQPYQPDTVRRKFARVLYLISFLPIYALFLIMKQSTKHDRRIPRPLAWFWVYFAKSSHFAHDHFFKPIFGSGENMGLDQLYDSSHK